MITCFKCGKILPGTLRPGELDNHAGNYVFPYDCSGGMYAVNKNMLECIENVMLPCRIEKVIFQDPATIVIWKNKTKTVVKCHDEPFDREKGLAMCIAKKVLGKDFHKTFRGWCE